MDNTGFLDLIERHWLACLLLLLGMLVLLFIVARLARIFNWGRYSYSTTSEEANPWLDLAAKIIDQFRHLLALIIIVIFAFALGFALFRSWSCDADLSQSLQAIMSTLGGLVGSIIGYYFGESKGANNSNTAPTPQGPPPLIKEGPPGNDGPGIPRPAPERIIP